MRIAQNAGSPFNKYEARYPKETESNAECGKEEAKKFNLLAVIIGLKALKAREDETITITQLGSINIFHHLCDNMEAFFYKENVFTVCFAEKFESKDIAG